MSRKYRLITISHLHAKHSEICSCSFSRCLTAVDVQNEIVKASNETGHFPREKIYSIQKAHLPMQAGLQREMTNLLLWSAINDFSKLYDAVSTLIEYVDFEVVNSFTVGACKLDDITIGEKTDNRQLT